MIKYCLDNHINSVFLNFDYEDYGETELFDFDDVKQKLTNYFEDKQSQNSCVRFCSSLYQI